MNVYLEQLVACLPKQRVPLIFAYGSGAVAQSGQSTSKNVVDFVVVADDAQKWHESNLLLNRKFATFSG